MVDQPHPHPAMVAPLDGGDGQRHRQRAHQQHERADRREWDVVEAVRRRPDTALWRYSRYVEISAPKSRHSGSEERPHGHLGVGDAGRRSAWWVSTGLRRRGPATVSARLDRSCPRRRFGLIRPSLARRVARRAAPDHRRRIRPRQLRRPRAALGQLPAPAPRRPGAASGWPLLLPRPRVGLGIDGGLEGPGVQATEQHQDAADGHEPQPVDLAVGDDRQPKAATSGQNEGEGMWTWSPSGRGFWMKSAAVGDLDQPARLVLGVLAVPEVVLAA